MGAIVQGRCFNSQTEAADAYFLAVSPQLTPGDTSYLQYFEKVAGTWMLIRKTVDGNGAVLTLSSSTAPVPVFPDCDPLEGFTDGQTLGWLMAGVMVLCWGLLRVRRLVA